MGNQLLISADAADHFLSPMNNRGNSVKPLLIPGFISKVMPEFDENVIELGPHAKLPVSFRHKKPKLNEVTLSEFNIANMRIMYRLLETGQLSSYADIKGYLCYAVKINELAGKFK